jgi:hypothetical protein
MSMSLREGRFGRTHNHVVDFTLYIDVYCLALYIIY